MTRGQRNGALTKEELLTRLRTAFPDAKFPATVKLSALLGHARYYGLISDHELDETTPRTETVIPCYLFTWVADRLCGPRLSCASDCSVPVWRPGWIATPAQSSTSNASSTASRTP